MVGTTRHSALATRNSGVSPAPSARGLPRERRGSTPCGGEEFRFLCPLFTSEFIGKPAPPPPATRNVFPLHERISEENENMLLTSQNRFASVFARCAPISGPSSQRPRFGAKPCNRRVNPNGMASGWSLKREPLFRAYAVPAVRSLWPGCGRRSPTAK